MRPVYRARQFWAALRSRPSPAELEQVRAILSPPLMAIFLSMQPSEQAHSLRIFHQLQAQGPAPHDLLVAALLHDAGKSRCPLKVWERMIIVVARAVLKKQVVRWGQEQNPGVWNRAFIVAEQHPVWGAELAALAGASPLAVALIRRHQDAPPTLPPAESAAGLSLEDQLLIRLQQLDDQN